MRKYFLLGFLSILFVAGCSSASVENVVAPDGAESVLSFVLEETDFDFGVIKQSGGIVSHDFKFRYEGVEPVHVTSVPSSCACTTAEISKDDFLSGEEGVLTVLFDPNLHEEPLGRFFKTVTILTDPSVALGEEPEVKIWVEIDLDLGPHAYKLQEAHEDGDGH
jgi:hypothetical protein